MDHLGFSCVQNFYLCVPKPRPRSWSRFQPGYRRYVAEVMTRWLDRGVRGWRLDSAWSAPASFWRPVLTEVRRRHPGAWLLGQVFDDDLPGVVNGTPYSAATEYALMHGVRAWLAGGPAESTLSAASAARAKLRP